MNKLGIHESELNTVIKEKRCWHPAHSHHTFSEKALQWGSACTPLGRALPPHGLQLPSSGWHADTPNTPKGKVEWSDRHNHECAGGTARPLHLSRKGTHWGENWHPPEMSVWSRTRNRKVNKGDKTRHVWRGAATEPAHSPGLRQTHGREVERRPADRGSERAVSTRWEASAEVAGRGKQDTTLTAGRAELRCRGVPNVCSPLSGCSHMASRSYKSSAS